MKYQDLSDESLIGEGYDLLYGSEASDEEKEELVAWMDEAGRRWSPEAWERQAAAERAEAASA